MQLLRQQAAAGDITLLFGDEAEALTHPYPAHRCWARRGADLRIPGARPSRAARPARGVLDAATNELIVRTSATKRSGDVIARLGDLDRRYGPAAAAGPAGPAGLAGLAGPARPGKPVMLVLDHGASHTSKASRAALAAQPWLVVEGLPTSAPELNAIERGWRDLKRHDLANQTFTEANDLDRRLPQAVRRRNLERAPHPSPNLPNAA